MISSSGEELAGDDTTHVPSDRDGQQRRCLPWVRPAGAPPGHQREARALARLAATSSSRADQTRAGWSAPVTAPPTMTVPNPAVSAGPTRPVVTWPATR